MQVSNLSADLKFPLSLGCLAKAFGLEVSNKDASIIIHSVASFDKSCTGDLTFIHFGKYNQKQDDSNFSEMINRVNTSSASAVIVNKENAQYITKPSLITTGSARSVFAKIMMLDSRSDDLNYSWHNLPDSMGDGCFISSGVFLRWSKIR